MNSSQNGKGMYGLLMRLILFPFQQKTFKNINNLVAASLKIVVLQALKTQILHFSTLYRNIRELQGDTLKAVFLCIPEKHKGSRELGLERSQYHSCSSMSVPYQHV